MNETQEERQTRAQEELSQKIKLEKPLSVQIRQLLRNMADDLSITYAATGTILNADQYLDDFVGILKPAYRKASKFFGTQAEKELEKLKENTSATLLVAAFAALAARRGQSIDIPIAEYVVAKNNSIMEFINRAIPFRANEITRTNQKELDRSISRAYSELTKIGEPFGSREVGTLAARNFKVTSLWRGNMIASTEIQNASESSKNIEAETLEASLRPIRNQEYGRLQTLKEWHTQGDERVRQMHVLADLQSVPVNDPYEVGGELLNYPGDTSLGASPGNTINCRCSSVVFLDGSIPD